MTQADRSSGRRQFLTGLMATALVLPAGRSFAQNIDPYTGMPVYGSAGGAAPDLGVFQVDPDADQRRNQSSFRAWHWSDFYPSLGKGVILADVTSRALHYWSADKSVYLLFPTAVPVSEDLTRRGKTEIVRKAENPPWTPTPSMRERSFAAATRRRRRARKSAGRPRPLSFMACISDSRNPRHPEDRPQIVERMLRSL